ncbi:MAG TPA: DUF5063 domain-containing protein [Dermatophilaceae bacterium]|nr:DUF5063 domain-containing protein [Dermatophilaceae bacterium]
MSERDENQDEPQGGPGDLNEEVTELSRLAVETARDATAFLATVREMAAGTSSEYAIPVLLLASTQMLAAGARLGAIHDIVPAERYEADPGADVDIDPLRQGLVNLFDGLDDYAHVVDPLLGVEVASGSLSNDLAEIASALTHGLQHYEAGRVSEALWWWQFSFLSSWGDAATSVVRVLLAVLGHIRLDADEDLVSEAEFDALHP